MAIGYSFTILADEISAGVPLSQQEIVADRGLGRQSRYRVLTAKFGDGYEQRVLDGINTKEEEFSASYNNRPEEEISLIADYLDLKAAKSFDLTVDGETLKVVCDGYSTSYGHDTNHSLQATFRRVYEP